MEKEWEYDELEDIYFKVAEVDEKCPALTRERRRVTD